MTKIVKFAQNVESRCIEIFLSNQGKYFDQSELTMFSDFLKNESLTEEFYTIMEDGIILGCGGIEKTGPKQVDLTWGMIHRDHHRIGFGRALLMFRMDRIRDLFGDVTVRIETSQHVKGFFEKHGFVSKETKIDGFGKGIDCVLMIKEGEQGRAHNSGSCAASA